MKSFEGGIRVAFSFFFRDAPPLEYAVQHVVPFASGRSKIRVWDAGAAMGQEPYTLAILLAESMNQFAFRNLKIYTTDIEESFSSIIKNGIYPEDELQRIPREFFKKYFTTNGTAGFYQLCDTLRNAIVHQAHDLLSLKSIGEDFCLVVCKNVLLHFQQPQRIEVIRMFHKALAPGGFLLMEHTQKLPDELSSMFEKVVPDAQLFRTIWATS
jgi:chemotaxis protein methyltransferase CheR